MIFGRFRGGDSAKRAFELSLTRKSNRFVRQRSSCLGLYYQHLLPYYAYFDTAAIDRQLLFQLQRRGGSRSCLNGNVATDVITGYETEALTIVDHVLYISLDPGVQTALGLMY